MNRRVTGAAVVDARVIAVAYSGGRDSTALLHAVAHEAASIGIRVAALHVHHGLSANADDWLAHCKSQCERWAKRGLPVDFHAHRLNSRPSKGESVEAWARSARYEALRSMASAAQATVVLLAHHRRDQAETFLLQALRGAGLAGLSSMPSNVEREGIAWRRPWLQKTRAAIDSYIREHRLKYIDDDSNTDPRFARNRLRIEVWPALEGAFDDVETSLAMTADWAQESNAALEELASLDLATVSNEQGLQVAAWTALSPARRSNSLRAWLKSCRGSAAPASLITRLRDELPLKRSARWPLGGSELRVYRGVLRFEPAEVRERRTIPLETVLGIREVGFYVLRGWRGGLVVEHTKNEGVPLAWLARVELRERVGGERFQSGFGRPPRSLKKQFQDAGVPMWERGGPLVYSGGQLVFVPGLGLDSRVLGLDGQALVTLRWVSAEVSN